jgi:hypothetical protein
MELDQNTPCKQHAWLKAIINERYQKLGRPFQRIVKRGGDQHPHALSDQRPIVEFIDGAWAKRERR